MKLTRLDYNDTMLDIPLDKLPAHVHESKSNYHCGRCMQDGCNTPRFYVVYNWGKSPNWTHTFPCFDLMNEWIKPFLKLGVDVMAYGKVTQ